MIFSKNYTYIQKWIVLIKIYKPSQILFEIMHSQSFNSELKQ